MPCFINIQAIDMNVLIAILPVFLIILCGFILRINFLSDEGFWRGAEKITYFLLFPALLVSKMLTANLAGINFIKLITIIIVMFLLISILLIILKSLFKISNAQFTSVYQGGIRFNTYIGLAIISSLYHAQGLVAAIIIAAIMIPVINILCVFILELYSNRKSSVTKLFSSIMTNPLILACAIGMGLNISKLAVPSFIQETLNIFSSAALTLGLLTVGAALKIKSIHKSMWPLLLSSTIKFAALPLLAFYLCELWDVETHIQNALIILTALPTATASYVLARQLGGDYELMATIITGQTLLACIIMPFSISLLT